MKAFPATEGHSHGLSIRGAALIAVALVLVLALLLIGAPAGAGDRGEISYAGKLLGYPRPDDIRFDVERQADKNLRVSFEARNVQLVCEDDTFPYVDFPRLSFRFLGPRVFQGQRYERQPNGDWTYYEVKGRLRSNGRALGYLYYIEEPYDPPGTENRAECSTGGQLIAPWRAERIR